MKYNKKEKITETVLETRHIMLNDGVGRCLCVLIVILNKLQS